MADIAASVAGTAQKTKLAESGRSYCAWREKYCSRTRRRTPADQWRTHYKLYPGCQG